MKALQSNAHLVAHPVGSSSHLGNVELIALIGSLFHAQTNGLSHIIEELLPKCEDEPLLDYQKHLYTPLILLINLTGRIFYY